MTRWLLPCALLIALAGYFGPWVDHRVAGLVVTGLDLGEYVKFLPVVRSESVTLWRPGFYAPLVAISAAATLAAFRIDFAYRWWGRAFLLAIATVAALNLVPPAWTPTRLLEAEFRWQTGALLSILAAVACAPMLALLPIRLAAAVVTLLSAVGIIAPVQGFTRVLPAISELYNHPILPGWGMWLMFFGLALTAIAFWLPPSMTKLRLPPHSTSPIM